MAQQKRTLKGGRVVYRCFCGQEAVCSEAEWEAGIRSCKCTGKEIEFPTFNLMGKTFGQLVAIAWIGVTPENVNRWRCRCKCGTRETFTSMQLINGEVKDCGCVATHVAEVRKARAARKAANKRKRKVTKLEARAERAALQASKAAKNAEALEAIGRAKAEAERLRQAEMARLREYAEEQTKASEAAEKARRAERLKEQRRVQMEAERQRAQIAKRHGIFKLTATAHLRPRAGYPDDSFPRAAATALAIGEDEVTYRCYCGQEARCTRQAWEAGVTACTCAAEPSPLPFYDFRGETLGELTLLRWTHAEPASRNRLTHHYEAICSCGNTAEVTSISFSRQGHRMCGKCYSRQHYAAKVDPANAPMPPETALNLSGKRLGKLTAVAPVASEGHALWQVRCDCGHVDSVATVELITGRARACKSCEEEEAALQVAQSAHDDDQVTTLETLARLERPHAQLLKLGTRIVDYKCFCGERVSCSRDTWEQGINACSCHGTTDRFPLLDLHGLQVGNLIVKRWAGLTAPPRARQQRWECGCACGNPLTVLETELLKRQRTSCGCLPPLERQASAPDRIRGRPPRLPRSNLTGQTFGELTVVGGAPGGAGKVHCRCSCGQYVEVTSSALESRRVTSCGCQPAPATGPGRRPVVVHIAAPAAGA